MSNYTLGLDSSTQSLSAVLFDIDKAEIAAELSVSYRNDPRLQGYGIDHSDMIIPPREPGEADQPPKLFLASIDAILADLKAKGFDLGRVKAVNVSGQQHGHVYLGKQAGAAFATLRETATSPNVDLVNLLGESFSYGTSPIWKTANTEAEAGDLRKGAGGKKAMIALSGSDSPLRFTGAVIRRVGRQFPKAYEATEIIPLISSFVPAVLCGDHRVPLDYGNGAGTSLMNYEKKDWDDKLVKAAGDRLPGGPKALRSKLPAVAHPLTVVGTIASYFCRNYGFANDCKVVVGSGDNPQTKVLAGGDLLSLGTSFVIMSETGGQIDPTGYSNAMYDGLGRPFRFGCRTNGALVWDKTKELYGIAANDHAAAEKALNTVAPASVQRFWQPDNESFPPSKPFALTRLDNEAADFAHDYAGLVDSALGLLWSYAVDPTGRDSSAPTDRAHTAPGKTGSDPETETGKNSASRRMLSLAGGPSSNPYIVARVAAIWNAQVTLLGRSGAALGTALSAAAALLPEDSRDAELARFRKGISAGASVVDPDPVLVKAYHSGYLERLRKAYDGIITQ